MKICHLTSVHQYNDIRIFRKECQSLVKGDYHVHLIAPDTDIKKENGIKIHGIKNPYKSRIKRIIKFPKEIYSKAIEIDADIYHFHDPELIPIALKLKKRGKKVIYDVHEDVPRAILSKYWIPRFIRKSVSFLFEKYENICSKKFDYIVGATPFITRRFLGINKNSVTINNFPLLHELITEKQEITKDKQVCYVGGLTQIRGIENIVESSNKIEGDIILAGPISSDGFKNSIKKSNVKYLGILDRQEVSQLLNKSIAGLVLFHPEPNHINAQPNKMFEYMSAGIPVIASNFSLWKEIIEGNDCGICVDPLNVSEIAQAIQWMLDNPEKAVEMGENGRKAVETKYNWEAESEKIIKLYEELS